MPRPAAELLSALLGCVILGGCALVDQRSFDRRAGRAPVPHAPERVAHGPAPVPPLFVVQVGAPEEEWRPGLRQAVAEALARKPNVLFTVQSVVPLASSPSGQAAAIRTAGLEQGVPVADAIVADGARPSQVEMQAASDPGLQRPEVRIAVR